MNQAEDECLSRGRPVLLLAVAVASKDEVYLVRQGRQTAAIRHIV